MGIQLKCRFTVQLGPVFIELTSQCKHAQPEAARVQNLASHSLTRPPWEASLLELESLISPAARPESDGPITLGGGVRITSADSGTVRSLTQADSKLNEVTHATSVF